MSDRELVHTTGHEEGDLRLTEAESPYSGVSVYYIESLERCDCPMCGVGMHWIFVQSSRDKDRIMRSYRGMTRVNL